MGAPFAFADVDARGFAGFAFAAFAFADVDARGFAGFFAGDAAFIARSVAEIGRASCRERV